MSGSSLGQLLLLIWAYRSKVATKMFETFNAEYELFRETLMVTLQTIWGQVTEAVPMGQHQDLTVSIQHLVQKKAADTAGLRFAQIDYNANGIKDHPTVDTLTLWQNMGELNHIAGLLQGTEPIFTDVRIH
jgi:hypothetical protein